MKTTKCMLSIALVLALGLYMPAMAADHPAPPLPAATAGHADDVGIQLTFLGCASLKIDCGDVTFLMDPFIPTLASAEHQPTASHFGAGVVLLSHGHFDHAIGVIELSRAYDIRVYCTNAAKRNLVRRGVSRALFHLIEPGDVIAFGDVSVRVYESRHGSPDIGIMLGTLRRSFSSLSNFWDALRIGLTHLAWPDGGENVIFEIQAQGKRIVVVSTLGFLEDSLPQQGADILVVPFNGRSDPTDEAMKLVQAMQPRAVLLSHHDNAFPPITTDLSREIGNFLNQMREKHPAVNVVVPAFNETMRLEDIVGGA